MCYADAYNNLGIALQDQGKLDKQESFLAFPSTGACRAHHNLSSIKKYKIECSFSSEQELYNEMILVMKQGVNLILH